MKEHRLFGLIKSEVSHIYCSAFVRGKEISKIGDEELNTISNRFTDRIIEIIERENEQKN